MADTIISLSTIPPRMAHIGPVLQSLLAQDLPPAEVVLWVPRAYRRFPDWDGRLPELPRGIRLARCDEDFGPATKLLPTLDALSGQDLPVLFCDDDSLYAPDWHRSFVQAADQRPGAIIAGQGHDLGDILPVMRPPERQPRVQLWAIDELIHHLGSLPPPLPPALPNMRQSGHADYFLGRAGVMIRTAMFDRLAFQVPARLWGHDDLWLSGLAEADDIPIWAEASIPNPASIPCLRMIRPLLFDQVAGRDRATIHARGVAYLRKRFGIWPATPPEGVLVLDGASG